VEHILRGEYDRAQVAHPRFSLDDFNTLAEATHAKAARPRLFPDPRHLAVGNDLTLLPRAPRGVCGEGVAFGRVAFEPSIDPREQGLSVLHGLAHAILHSEDGGSSDTDAWLLTGCLWIRRSTAAVASADPPRVATHVPLWFVWARLIQVSLWENAAP
jgi:hypothetical protein